ADDRDLPISVQTDYILEPGSRAVQIETTITNTGAAPVDTFLGDYINGSGQVELFQPGYGFGEPLITTGCPAKTYKGCRFGSCDLAVIAAGADGPGTSTNVFDHFRTAADGTYRGTLPGGTYTVRANKDGRLFGTPDPANVAVASKGTTTQDFVLPGPGSLRVTV